MYELTKVGFSLETVPVLSAYVANRYQARLHFHSTTPENTRQRVGQITIHGIRSSIYEG